MQCGHLLRDALHQEVPYPGAYRPACAALIGLIRKVLRAGYNSCCTLMYLSGRLMVPPQKLSTAPARPANGVAACLIGCGIEGPPSAGEKSVLDGGGLYGDRGGLKEACAPRSLSCEPAMFGLLGPACVTSPQLDNAQLSSIPVPSYA